MSQLIHEIPFPDLSSGTHLLLDENVVADAFRLRRTLHQPRPDGKIEFLDAKATPEAWEAIGIYPTRVVHDAERGIYRLWYYVYNFENEQKQWELRRKQLGEPQRIYLCYAESEDGRHWTRPDLHIYDDAEGQNNICFKGFSQCSGPTILLPGESPLADKYLLFNCDWFSNERGGLAIAESDDGIHWQYRPDQPVVWGHFDTTNSAVYNFERHVWMWYSRAFHSAAYGWEPKTRNTRRRVAYSQSADLGNWSEQQVVLRPDELDTNDFYSLTVFRYADYYLGQLQVYDEEGRESIHIELAWSRDGMNWSRLPTRPAFIPAGETTGMMILSSQTPLESGEELLFHYAAFPNPHNVRRDQRLPTPIYRARLRRDGFVSLSAGRPLGSILTRPFTLQSDRILINARTWAGEITAELVEPYSERLEGDYGGKAIEGFGAEDFEKFEGDSTSHELRWKGDLKTLHGRRLMLRMSLFCGEIWSITL